MITQLQSRPLPLLIAALAGFKGLRLSGELI